MADCRACGKSSKGKLVCSACMNKANGGLFMWVITKDTEFLTWGRTKTEFTGRTT